MTEKVDIETAPERKIIGTSRRYTMENRHEIPGQWDAFFRSGIQVENMVPGSMFGLSFDVSESGFTYGVGVAVDAVPSELPEGTCEMVLSEGSYAVLRNFGPISELPQHFDWLFLTWLPASGFQQRVGAVFERYPDNPDSTPEEMEYEIWVPVAKA